MSKRVSAGKAALAPARSAAATRQILSTLGELYPGADTELHFSNAYQLLVATILSAQCTDERVNQVTPALFMRYPDARALARAATSELEPQIQSTGFFRAKSKSLHGMATALVERHGGEVPNTMDALVTLPGVGRKTANVVLGHALGVPGLPVDRHVLRVANRIGIARSDDPVVVETQLCEALLPAEWTRASDTLILHGRRVCKPRPLCDKCPVTDDCEYFQHVVSKEDARRPATRATRRKRLAGPTAPPRTSPSQQRRAAKPRGKGPQKAPVADAAPSTRNSQERRAAKLRGPGPQRGPSADAAPTTRNSQERRAAKPRGTGRGGGAPRLIKK